MTIYIPHQKFVEKIDNIDLSVYFDFIKENSLPKSLLYETANHHILPKWAFPEYSKFADFSWNKAILTHKNHLIAHFLLWDSWNESSNASALLLMCTKKCRAAWSLEDITRFSDKYHEACKKHGENVTLKQTGKKIKSESIIKAKQTRLSNGIDKTGMMNCILISTGESVHITNTEYEANKNILYKHFSADKPAWNSGIEMHMLKNKISVIQLSSNSNVHISSDEYFKNKHLYRHYSTGSKHKLGYTPVYNVETGIFEKVSTDDYRANLEKYEHPTSKLEWYNNGIENKRKHPSEEIPEGFVKGRLKSDFAEKKTLTCPHCNLSGGAGGMKRYHFEKCKIIR